MKKVIIQNAVGGSGKDTLATLLNKCIPTTKYSIIDLVKQSALTLGWDGGKTEKDRKFLSDLMDLATAYNDSPYKDVCAIVSDFKNDYIETEILIIDMRDPKDITRAVEDFGANTLLIRNPKVAEIESNHADANVENYEYDYIIENDGTLDQLEKVAKMFCCDIICGETILDEQKPLIFKCSDY